MKVMERSCIQNPKTNEVVHFIWSPTLGAADELFRAIAALRRTGLEYMEARDMAIEQFTALGRFVSSVAASTYKRVVK